MSNDVNARLDALQSTIDQLVAKLSAPVATVQPASVTKSALEQAIDVHVRSQVRKGETDAACLDRLVTSRDPVVARLYALANNPPASSEKSASLQKAQAASDALDQMVRERVAKSGMTEPQAWEFVLKSAQGSALYAKQIAAIDESNGVERGEHSPVVKDVGAESELESLVAKYQRDRPGVTEAQAFDAVLKTAEGAALYAKAN